MDIRVRVRVYEFGFRVFYFSSDDNSETTAECVSVLRFGNQNEVPLGYIICNIGYRTKKSFI